jgi:XTP/dITP diphosphohydrolase
VDVRPVKLLLATTNLNKLREIRPIVDHLSIDFLTLADLPPIPEPEESGSTFWENARLKAFAYGAATSLTVVAEDSGLEIHALAGAPGVQSARFLGVGVPYPVRFEAIYQQLERARADDRAARFVTALAVVRGADLLFETETSIDGQIAVRPAGSNGFGYDPIFHYPPLGKTTGEMTLQDKAAVSHRARAFRDFARWWRLELAPRLESRRD